MQMNAKSFDRRKERIEKVTKMKTNDAIKRQIRDWKPLSLWDKMFEGDYHN